MADLTTLANVKAWLGVTANTDDALLTRLIASASTFIQTWLNRDLAQQARVETRDGNGGNVMVFANYPVSAVASVVVDGYAIPASVDPYGAGYRFDATRIILTGYSFPRGFGNVVLTYTAGYATTPHEIEQACIELVSLRYRERDRIGHQSKSIGGETVSFIVKDMPDSVKTILNNYRKVILL